MLRLQTRECQRRKISWCCIDDFRRHAHHPHQVQLQVYFSGDGCLQHGAYDVQRESAVESLAKEGIVFNQAFQSEHPFRKIVRNGKAMILKIVGQFFIVFYDVARRLAEFASGRPFFRNQIGIPRPARSCRTEPCIIGLRSTVHNSKLVLYTLPCEPCGAYFC